MSARWPKYAACSEGPPAVCHPNNAPRQCDYQNLGEDHSPPAIYESMYDEKSEKDQSDIPDSGIQRHSNSDYVNSADFHDYQEYGRDKSSPGIYRALHDKNIVEDYCDISDIGIQ